MGKRLNGGLIKAIRKAIGQRQEDLAALAGISERSVRDAERGNAVGIDVCTRLAKALRIEPPDQLFAEKGLRLDQVRRLDEGGEPVDQAAPHQKKGTRPEHPISRVRLDLSGRQGLRRYLLARLTPTSGFTLEPGGIRWHGEVIGEWNQAAHEGFISACVFFLENETIGYQDGACGNTYTFLKSVLMGRHAKIVFETGEADDVDFPRTPEVEVKIERIWDEAAAGPGGSLLDDLHRYCPTFEPTSYYRGWLECCYWLTGNAVLNEEHNREKSVPFYQGLLLDLIRTELDRFEDMIADGRQIFWATVWHYLRHQFGEFSDFLDEAAFRQSHGYTFEDVLHHVGRSLEFREGAIEQYKGMVDSYPDRETGYEVALLKLQSEFVCTGKLNGTIYEMKTARIPRR